MPADFRATPEELRRVSAELDEVSSAMKDIISTLRKELAAEGPVWGDGDFGHQFADGPNGFLAQFDWVGGSIDAKTGLLDYYAGLLKQAADAFQQSDDVGTSAANPDAMPGQNGSSPYHAIGGGHPTDANGGPRAGTTPMGQPGTASAAPAAAESGGAGGSGGIADSAAATDGDTRTNNAPTQGESTPGDTAAGRADSAAPPPAGSTGDAATTDPDPGRAENVASGMAPSGAMPAAAGTDGSASSPTAVEPSTPLGPPMPPFPPARPSARRADPPEETPDTETPDAPPMAPPELVGPAATGRRRRATPQTAAERDADGAVDSADTDHRAPASTPAELPGTSAGRAGVVDREAGQPDGAAPGRRGRRAVQRRSDTGDQRALADGDDVGGYENRSAATLFGGDEAPQAASSRGALPAAGGGSGDAGAERGDHSGAGAATAEQNPDGDTQTH